MGYILKLQAIHREEVRRQRMTKTERRGEKGRGGRRRGEGKENT